MQAALPGETEERERSLLCDLWRYVAQVLHGEDERERGGVREHFTGLPELRSPKDLSVHAIIFLSSTCETGWGMDGGRRGEKKKRSARMYRSCYQNDAVIFFPLEIPCGGFIAIPTF